MFNQREKKLYKYQARNVEKNSLALGSNLISVVVLML